MIKQNLKILQVEDEDNKIKSHEIRENHDMRVETIARGFVGGVGDGVWGCGNALLKLRREAFEEVVHRLSAISPTPHASFGGGTVPLSVQLREFLSFSCFFGGGL